MTPTTTHVKITKDITRESVDLKLYRNMIGSMLYLTASRSDIAYVVDIYARFQSDPHVSHLPAIQTLIKYVHGRI